MSPTALVLVLVVCGAILYLGQAYFAWVCAGASLLAYWAGSGVASPLLFKTACGAMVVLIVVFGIVPVRRVLVSSWLRSVIARWLPRLSQTEKTALEAGTVWWDGDLFSGNPDWHKLLDFQVAGLTEKEKAFLDGPVQELCLMLDDWKIEQLRDLPEEVWQFLKDKGFFGIIIPEEFGGLGFTPTANSAVVVKVASRSITGAITMMVPNSLGPAELLLHYGTDEQKKHYLPRLARGEEIPCFALTGPEAGSDAASTESVGIVARGQWKGEEVLGMRLTWAKRYITLGPHATVIGLAFRMKDPDHLLGSAEDLGMTCALVPSDLPGIEIGDRHDPLGIPFSNGPTFGKDVFVPLDCIIGGKERAGKGWRMLMECLAAGRGISLPAMATSGVQMAARVSGAYATVREQFDMPIGRFEGIEEPLARIGGAAYFMNAARTVTCGALNAGHKPSVISAIVKAYMTESMRRRINDAMDIRAGAAICRGPRNILARAYMSAPIGITVEGANILTRSMIIYGQGAIRCHPFVLEEMLSVQEKDTARFDRAFFGHLGFTARNVVRSFVLALTGGRLCRPAGVDEPLRGYMGRFSALSSSFALVSDVVMATLGSALKRREKLSGRLADALAWMYIGSCSMKYFYDRGQDASELPYLRYSCDLALYKIQKALKGVIDNLDNPAVAWLLRVLVLPTGARLRPPSDALGADVARSLLEDREGRLRLTPDIFVPPETEAGLGQLEAALDKCVIGMAATSKIKAAVRAGKLQKAPFDLLLHQAVEAGVISAEESQSIADADAARDQVIQVDAFKDSEYQQLSH